MLQGEPALINLSSRSAPPRQASRTSTMGTATNADRELSKMTWVWPPKRGDAHNLVRCLPWNGRSPTQAIEGTITGWRIGILLSAMWRILLPGCRCQMSSKCARQTLCEGHCWVSLRPKTHRITKLMVCNIVDGSIADLESFHTFDHMVIVQIHDSPNAVLVNR